MKNLLKIFALFSLVSLINSCAVLDQISSQNKRVMQPLDYLDKAPKFNVRNLLDGNLEGFAIVQNGFGKIEKSFTIKGNGQWEENKGTVRYDFAFNDGKKDSRTWLITVNDSESYSAIGHDFVGPAFGRQQGNASEIIYTLFYDHKGKKEKVSFQENLYLVDENSAIIISDMRIKNDKIGKMIISLKRIPNDKN